MLRRALAALALLPVLFCAPTSAQDCAPPSIVANAKSSNMFSPEQEMVFGELWVQNMAGEMRFIRDERLTAYVAQIGERLTKHLPPTGLRFRFYLVDLPEANAFNIPGGYVFVSRKLVALAGNEDELAGVVAHELGHAVVRHAATDISDSLRKLVGVTSLGDRRDVTEKYNLLIERARTKQLSRRRGHEDGQQLEADRIGLYSMVAAGYDPSASHTLFERLTEAKAKGGGWFSDLFGNATPTEKRLREMIDTAEKMPASCRERAAARPTEEFLRWQADVVSFREAARKEELPGLLWKKELQPKLRSDVSHFAFSADGRLLLAQDDFSVTVINRDPLRVLFQIPAEDADDAAFTPDGKFVVFTTENLRYEKWSVADAAPVAVRELVLRRDCWEHSLSPDGEYLACVDASLNASVLDVKTGKKVWEKKGFYQLDFYEYLVWFVFNRGDDDDSDFFRIRFSPDSRYVMFSRSHKHRVIVRFDVMSGGGSEDTALALDLTTLKQVDVGGDLKKVAARAYVFLDPGTVLGVPSQKIGDAGVFAFPSGKRLRKFQFGAREVKATANPDYVIIKPVTEARMGVFDVKRASVVTGLDKADATLWGSLLALESINGKVLLREVGYDEGQKALNHKEVGTIELPVGAISGLDAASVSDDFGWLVMSSKTRGGLWNLSTGERKVYVRGFKGALAANDGGALGDFPRLGDVKHTVVLMNGQNGNAAGFRELPEKGARQYGRLVLLRSSLSAKEKKEQPAAPPGADADDDGDLDLHREARFELKDVVQDKVMWSRDFPKEVPEYSFDEYSGRLIFYWRLGTDAGKAKLKESPELKARADSLGNKADDYLVEVVDAFAQKTVGAMLLETGKGSFDVGEGLSEGDWLVVHDSEGRLLVYSIRTGELRHRFFGDTAAINPRRNQIVVENFPGEVSLYDLETGDQKAFFRVNGGAAFVRFNLAGNRLFVLSDAQSAYAFDLDKLAPQQLAK